MQQYRGLSHAIMILRSLIMVKNTVSQTKNTTPVRSGAWIVSLLIQLAALIIIGIISLHYGIIGILGLGLITVGYVFLTLRTIKLIQNKISDRSTLGVIHLIASVASFFIIAGFMAIFTSLPF